MHSTIIGIDPGVKTGFASYNHIKKQLQCQTVKIHKAFDLIKECIAKRGIENVFVRVEDARLRKWFGDSGEEKYKGAGSIMRDSKIWEDFLTDLGVDFELVAPKNNSTKLSAKFFGQLTGYTGRTSNHARDAAMLVYKFKPKKYGKT